MNGWLKPAIAWVVFSSSFVAATAADRLPDTPQLFVDLHRIENAHPNRRWKRMDNVRRTFHQARVHPRPVLQPEAPWEHGGFTTSVIYDREEQLFKMWYLTSIRGLGNVTCYAVSNDGIRWRRPNLGLHEYDGSKQNNIVFPVDYQEGKTHWETVLKDPLEKDPARKYKAIGWSSYDWDGPMSGIYTAVSPDGLRWKTTPEPVFRYHPRPGTNDLGPVGDAQSMMIDTLRNRYVAFLRHFPHRALSFSQNFLDWSPPETFIRTLHHRQEYYNSLGFVYSNQYLGVVTVFDLNQHRHDMNCWLMSSRDGNRWERPPADQPLIECGGIGEWNRFCCRNGGSPPIRVEDELYIYFRGSGARHGPYEGPDNTVAHTSVGLAKIRVDGFASFGASFDGGHFVTTPWQLDGGSLLLNAKSEHGQIRVEVLDLDDQPLAGFSMEDCIPVSVNSTETAVRWKEHEDLSAAAGRTVRFRFHLENALLYSYRRG